MKSSNISSKIFASSEIAITDQFDRVTETEKAHEDYPMHA
jgi:hypothetical protein